MSESDDKQENVRLRVTADTPLTEIFVIDGQFSRVRKEVGRLEADLPPGIYTIKFKTGSLVKQVPAILEEGKAEVNILGPQMDFSSSAPIMGTRTKHEYHLEAAAYLSRQIHDRKGEGSQIFVFTRDLEILGAADTMKGLSLHNLSGDMLIDFSGQGKTGTLEMRSDWYPWAGFTIEVTPGTYRLRVKLPNAQRLEQTVVASEGWQTQVFLNVDDYVPGLTSRFPDLLEASVFMARPDVAFIPDAETFRLAEMARQGLTNRRNIIPLKDINQMLFGKFDNPMVGIYGAHLALLLPQAELALLQEVADNLHSLVGKHPDVRALDLYLAEKVGKSIDPEPYSAPPLLRTSWDIIINATASMPDLVPVASLAARVSEKIWGHGLWLTWREADEEDAGRTISERH